LALLFTVGMLRIDPRLFRGWEMPATLLLLQVHAGSASTFAGCYFGPANGHRESRTENFEAVWWFDVAKGAGELVRLDNICEKSAKKEGFRPILSTI
jgi:hypothetical protein